MSHCKILCWQDDRSPDLPRQSPRLPSPPRQPNPEPILSDLLPPDPRALALLLVLLSPAVGSFLALLADRLPRGESAVRPGSHCRRCHTRLQVRDLLPILSFALSRGRCRHCDAPIPPWHLYMELAALGLAGLALALGGPISGITLSTLILWLLLTLAICDLLWFRLPNMLNAVLALAALSWAGLIQLGYLPAPPHPLLPHTLAEALAGAVIGVALFWSLRVCYQKLRGRAGLGLGDVKLIGGLGALCGAWLLPHLMLLAALLALIGALIGGRRLKASRALPFGAALCAATALIWLLARLPH